MKLTDDDLQNLFQTDKPRDRSECLSAEELQNASTGQFSKSRREIAANHLAVCSDCSDDLKLLGAVQEWATAEAEQLKVGDGPTRISWIDRFRWLLSPRYAVSITVLIVVLVSVPVVIHLNRSADEPDVRRGGRSVDVITDPADNAQLDGPPERLSWLAPDHAYGYKVSLYDLESSLIWESGLIKDNSTAIPMEIRSKLKPDQVYFWRVTILDGAPKQSNLLRFTIRKNVQQH